MFRLHGFCGCLVLYVLFVWRMCPIMLLKCLRSSHFLDLCLFVNSIEVMNKQWLLASQSCVRNHDSGCCDPPCSNVLAFVFMCHTLQLSAVCFCHYCTISCPPWYYLCIFFRGSPLLFPHIHIYHVFSGIFPLPFLPLHVTIPSQLYISEEGYWYELYLLPRTQQERWT